jgi:peptidoglycan/LPS O-acetylase OafA/YrhL
MATVSTAFADTKKHYELLDGLRGVAALLVLWHHVFEGYSFAGGGPILVVNHGYLAVDFFFILSGFVLSYAYDDRWGKSLNFGSFLKRRLIRLHPMVVMGAVLGAITFLLQGSVQWDGTRVATSVVMWALLISMFMIPAVPGTPREIRGNGEMFPLNGTNWSLFFEYIGNLLYALFIRRLSTRWLRVLTILLGVLLAFFSLFDVSGYNQLGIGWTLDAVNFVGGLLRMLFPFTMGMLISREFRENDRLSAGASARRTGLFRPLYVKGSFWICTAVLVVLFHIPYIEARIPLCADGTLSGSGFFAAANFGALSLNALFELFCIMAVFPLLVVLAASGSMEGRRSQGVCNFLGDISYPLYAVHYPFMYLFYAYLIKNQVYTFGETWPLALGVCALSILVAWLSLRFYDIPLRRALSRRR